MRLKWTKDGVWTIGWKWYSLMNQEFLFTKEDQSAAILKSWKNFDKEYCFKLVKLMPGRIKTVKENLLCLIFYLFIYCWIKKTRWTSSKWANSIIFARGSIFFCNLSLKKFEKEFVKKIVVAFFKSFQFEKITLKKYKISHMNYYLHYLHVLNYCPHLDYNIHNVSATLISSLLQVSYAVVYGLGFLKQTLYFIPRCKLFLFCYLFKSVNSLFTYITLVMSVFTELQPMEW